MAKAMNKQTIEYNVYVQLSRTKAFPPGEVEQREQGEYFSINNYCKTEQSDIVHK